MASSGVSHFIKIGVSITLGAVVIVAAAYYYFKKKPERPSTLRDSEQRVDDEERPPREAKAKENGRLPEEITSTSRSNDEGTKEESVDTEEAVTVRYILSFR